MAKIQFNDLRDLRAAIIRGEEENVWINLKHGSGNGNGEYYKYIFQTHGHGGGFEGDQTDPSGNNLLLLTIASGKNALAIAILQDAKAKLSPLEFKQFVNYKYSYVDKAGAAAAGNHSFYINTALTLALKFDFFGLAKNLLDCGADLKICDYAGNNALQIGVCKLGRGSASEQALLSDLVQQFIKQGGDLLSHKNLAGLDSRDLLRLPCDVLDKITFRPKDSRVSSHEEESGMGLFEIGQSNIKWLCEAQHSKQEIDSRCPGVLNPLIQNGLMSVIASDVRDLWTNFIQIRAGFCYGNAPDEWVSVNPNEGIRIMESAENLAQLHDSIKVAGDHHEGAAAAGHW
jgi:hypothetical protein